MGAILFIVLIVCAFSYWSLAMSFLMAFSTRKARQYMERQSVRISRLLFRMANIYAGLKIEFDGKLGIHLPERFIIITNHQSLADIPFLIAAFPKQRLRFVAKKELGKFFPTVSPLLRYQHHALISRKGDFGTTYRALRKLAYRSKTGIVPVVFPEGTRSKTGVVGPFHEGAARMLLQIRPLPVVTVAIEGGHIFSRLWAVVTRMPGVTYRGKVTSVREAPSNKADIVSLLKDCRMEIIDQLERWRRPDEDPVPQSNRLQSE